MRGVESMRPKLLKVNRNGGRGSLVEAVFNSNAHVFPARIHWSTLPL